MKNSNKEKLKKAFLELPENYMGLGYDSTLEKVFNSGKFSQEKSGYYNQSAEDYPYRTCLDCVFYRPSDNPFLSPGTCQVVEGEIPWSGISLLYISSSDEAYKRIRRMQQEFSRENIEKEEKELIEKKIVSRGGKYFVMSEDGSKQLGGPYDSKDKAAERLRQIEGHKVKKLSADIEEGVKELVVDFIKSDDEKQIVMGIVLEPNVVDSQGDILTAETIEDAAHNFMQKSQVIGKQHEDRAKASVVESFVTLIDTKIGEQDVSKGTWVMAVKVHDEELWELVKSGEFTGFSIGGRGTRTKVELETES